MLGLYVHVPFCSAICNYCNFNRGLFDETLKTRYVDALMREIAGAGRAVEASGPGEAADTIYFGGGTPSLLEPGEIARIAACRQNFTMGSTTRHAHSTSSKRMKWVASPRMMSESSAS